MSVGVGIIGREVTFTMGASALVGVNSKGFTFNSEPLDVTDDNSSGWQERLATAGVKSLEFTISGIVKNLELLKFYVGTSQIANFDITYPDGSTLDFDAFMDNVSETGESNGLFTYDATFSSAGAPTFVAGT